MRVTGTLKTWHDDRGYGSIAPADGGPEVLLHHKELPRDGRRLLIGETLSFEIETDAEGRPRALRVQRPLGHRRHRHRRQHRKMPHPPSRRRYKLVVLLLVVLGLGLFGYEEFQRHGPADLHFEAAEKAAPATAEAPIEQHPPAAPPGSMRCDTRTQCSQMRSCAEARQFAQQCPGVGLDGNRDGSSCAQHWCS